MATRQQRRTRIKTTSKANKKSPSLWVFLSLFFMIVVLLLLFFFKNKIVKTSNLSGFKELIKQDTDIRNTGAEKNLAGMDNMKKKIIINIDKKEHRSESFTGEYKKEDMDYLNRIIKKK